MQYIMTIYTMRRQCLELKQSFAVRTRLSLFPSAVHSLAAAGWVWLELGGCGFTDLQRTYSQTKLSLSAVCSAYHNVAKLCL